MVKFLHFLVFSTAAALRRMPLRGDDTGVQKNNHIVCPVLAALHRGGALQTDRDGDVEMSQLVDALTTGLGNSKELADFQTYGICKFNRSQKGIETHSDACLPPTSCSTKRFVRGIVDEDTMRWFNLFTMNGKQALEHGMSTGIRGGDTNMPPNAIDCGGQYPCKKRFDQFFGDGGTPNGRFYMSDIMKVVCKARQYGDRGGEFAYAENSAFVLGNVPGREWQMKGAMGAIVLSFGKRDENGELYLTMADLKALFLEGRYPDGWQRREHGCLAFGCEFSAQTLFNMDVPCEVDYQEPFWQNTGCQVYTGRTCGIFSGCRDGETCVGRKCLCNRGGNWRTMCYEGGACREQPSDNYTWFGGPRVVVPDDNPKSGLGRPLPRGNPQQ